MSYKYKDLYGATHDVANNYKFDVPHGDDFSDNETVIGTFLGKPLYRKVIFAITPSSTSGAVIGTYKADVNEVIRCEGYVNDTNSNWKRFLPINYYYDATYNIATYYRVDNGTINMKVSSTGYYALPVKIILEYTKTTD